MQKPGSATKLTAAEKKVALALDTLRLLPERGLCDGAQRRLYDRCTEVLHAALA